MEMTMLQTIFMLILILTSLIAIALLSVVAWILNRYRKDIVSEWRLWWDIKTSMAEKTKEQMKNPEEEADWMQL
jgi:hypothetical protein